MKNYYIKESIKQNAPGQWNSTLVEIYCEDEKIGEYIRSYPQYAKETFHPFQQNGKDYALYSSNYTATRVMELPSCKDICGEDGNPNGFCPVEYYVPETTWSDKEYDEWLQICKNNNWENDIIRFDGQFGFIAGCQWGDNESWKVQYLDLSKISEGIFIRDERFGYIELPSKISLKDAIDVSGLEEDTFVSIATQSRFRISGEKL